MPPTFIDRNDDGRLDLVQVAPLASPVLLDASEIGLDVRLALNATYKWTLSGDSGEVFSAEGRSTQIAVPNGLYSVQLLIESPQRQSPITLQRKIEVNNMLVACIGDAFASGEGNPESEREPNPEFRPDQQLRPGNYPWIEERWADDLGDPEDRSSRLAHRSCVAAAAQVAKRLEDSSNLTSVTFLFLAASGATVDAGLLGPMYSAEHDDSVIPAQIPELDRRRNGRPIDFLLLSIGGNDIGLGPLLQQLVERNGPPSFLSIGMNTFWKFGDPYPSPWLEKVLKPKNRISRRPRPNEHDLPEYEPIFGLASSPLNSRYDTYYLPGIEGLSKALDQVQLSLTSRGIHPGQVLLVEYPDLLSVRYDQAYQEYVEDYLRSYGRERRIIFLQNADFTPDGFQDGDLYFKTTLTDLWTTGFVGSVVSEVRDKGISPREAEWVHLEIVPPLQKVMQEASKRHGWTYVGGVYSAFAGHGYAGHPPYDYLEDLGPWDPSTVRWIRTATESMAMQGGYSPHPNFFNLVLGIVANEIIGKGLNFTWDEVEKYLLRDFSNALTTGTMHPNELGHAIIAERIWSKMRVPHPSLATFIGAPAAAVIPDFQQPVEFGEEVPWIPFRKE